MAKADGDREEKIYHERQRLQLCGVHAINNLFQDGSAMNRELMNSICNNLSPNSFLNPHKSILGVGNYDINALMAALDMKGYEIVWFDKRRWVLLHWYFSRQVSICLILPIVIMRPGQAWTCLNLLLAMDELFGKIYLNIIHDKIG